MKVIPVQFPQPTFVPEEVAQVATSVRRAAVALSQHAGVAAKVHAEQAGRVACASVQVDGFQTAVAIGVYSSLRHRPLDEDVLSWIARRNEAPRVIGFDVHADVEWLLDPEEATSGSFGHEHVEREFADVEAALVWVRGHCLRAPKPRISLAELSWWRQRQVEVLKDSKKEKILFGEAVREYGNRYGRSTTAELLMQRHGLSAADAAAVTKSIWKVIPRKRS